MMLPAFQTSGKIPDSTDKLARWDIGLRSANFRSLIILQDILSGPEVAEFFNLFIAWSMSCSENIPTSQVSALIFPWGSCRFKEFVLGEVAGNVNRQISEEPNSQNKATKEINENENDESYKDV